MLRATAGHAPNRSQSPSIGGGRAAFGTQIGRFDATWFGDAVNGDFHLTARGAQVQGNVASLASEDP